MSTIDREFDNSVTPCFMDVVLEGGEELVSDGGEGVGAEHRELLQPRACCHRIEVAEEPVPFQVRVVVPLRGDDLPLGDESIVIARRSFVTLPLLG